jgi:hypothetical protein
MLDRGNGAGGNAQLIAEYRFEELPGPLGIGVAESGQSTLKRGWYLGTERFKEFLLSRAYRQGVKRKRYG